MNIWITAENFELKMNSRPATYLDEMFTYINVMVKTDSFYISEQMKVYTDDVQPFFNEFTDMYARLEGSAYIEEPYGNEMYIEFVCDKTGHITIEGSLYKHNGENTFSTYFVSKVDQSAISIA